MDIVDLHGSRIVAVARAAFARPDTLLLCFGESDQASPPAAAAALSRALARGETRYPDLRGLPALRDALAAHLTALHASPVEEARIQVTASGMTAMAVAFAALVRPGDRVVLHEPLWPNVANAVLLRGGEVDRVALDVGPDGGFRLDLDRFLARLPGARLVVLNSPNNPTGWTATGEDLTAILAACRTHGVWLVSDEVYSHLVYDGAPAAPSLLDFAEPDDRVIVCNSFSKAWAMTGWRLGWMVLPRGARDRVAEIVEVTHSGVAPFVQRGGIAALADTVFVEQFRTFCAEGRAMVADALGDLDGIRYTSPPGAFYAFLGLDGLRDSLALALDLVERHGVALAPGVAFGATGEGYLRLCFAQSPVLLSRALDRLHTGLRERL